MKIKKIFLNDWIIIKKFLRYSIWWALWASINVFLLWFFTDFFGIYYIISAVLAFLVALITGFFFQKYITFRNNSKKHFKQLFWFFIFQWIWLLIDLFLLRILVDKIWFYYIYVSIFNKWVTFIWNFFMNHFFTFYKNE